jgi:hypothetical protein
VEGREFHLFDSRLYLISHFSGCRWDENNQGWDKWSRHGLGDEMVPLGRVLDYTYFVQRNFTFD